MTPSLTTAVGLVAAVCTTGAFLPQALKTWRSGQSADLSAGMYALLLTGSSLWLAYGLLLGDLPLVAANVTGLALQLSIVVPMARHRLRTRRARP